MLVPIYLILENKEADASLKVGYFRDVLDVLF